MHAYSGENRSKYEAEITPKELLPINLENQAYDEIIDNGAVGSDIREDTQSELDHQHYDENEPAVSDIIEIDQTNQQSEEEDIESNDQSEEMWREDEGTSSENTSSSQSIDAISEGESQDAFEDPGEIYAGRPKRGRKRKHPGQTDKTRKFMKNSNKQHITKKGMLASAKEFTDYHCSCSLHCYEKVSVDIRKVLFEKFWAAGNYEHQNSMICSLVQENKVKRKRVPLSSIRNFSRTYSINNTVVCRNIFTNTLKISTKRVNTALQKSRSLSIADKRGKHSNRKKISDEREQEVISQISKIPTYISHYRRNETDKKFFATDMTIEKIYTQYKTEVQNPVSISTYKHIFYTKFNITRKQLKKDTCTMCDTLTVKISNATTEDEKVKVMESKREHQKAAEEARTQLKINLEEAKTADHIETLTFDLEKTLPLPRLPAGIVFYKRQLWLYNLGIHSGKTNKSHCFTWSEGVAGRGAQEVASCLIKYIETYVGREVTELNLWSDSCGGQNRNIKLTLLMKILLHNHPSLQVIRIRFLVSGHSFLPNDKDFGDIEKALKYHQRILTPEEYREVMRIARKKNPLVVHEMKKELFFSVKPLEGMFVNRKVDIDGNKISWLKSREKVLKKNSSYSLFLNKTFLPVGLIEVNLQGMRRGKHTKQKLDFEKTLPLLWPEGKNISSEKLQNIKELLELVENLKHEYYTNLMADENVVDDIDGYNVGQLDFELELEDND